MRHPTHLHSGDTSWPKVRILVYSLDDAFRFLVRQTFRKLAVREVLSTSVAADATPMMEQVPDIALVDVDGDVDAALAFLRRVREADSEMPVLLVAKASDRALVTGALPLGVEGFVPKPVSGHELGHRVGDSLKEPRRLPVPPPSPPVIPLTSPGGGSRPLGGGGAKGAMSAQGLAAAGHDRQAKAVSGGSYGDPAPVLGQKRPGGTWLDDDGPADGRKKASGGKYGDDVPVIATAPSPGGYGDLASDGPAGSPGGDMEALADCLPAKLKPKRRAKAEMEQAEAERAQWRAELAEQGHRSRQGGDVAGLDVGAIVAAHLSWLTTQGGEGKRADCGKMDLAGADLSTAVLANAGFRGADLSDARLTDARLDGADFRHAILAAADLAGADLGVAQMRHCDLRLANLQAASLRGADLSGARLGGAKLAGADFKGAILVGCDLAGADLSQVDGLIQAQIEKIVSDGDTRLPPGVRIPRKDS